VETASPLPHHEDSQMLGMKFVFQVSSVASRSQTVFLTKLVMNVVNLGGILPRLRTSRENCVEGKLYFQETLDEENVFECIE
jgi:hypothetical protein